MIIVRFGILSAIFAFGVLNAPLAVAQCTKDIECKHNRVCEGGICVNPSTAGSAPVVAQPEVPPSQPLPVLNRPQAAQPAPVNDIELQDLQSRRRAGRALLITGIVAVVVGGAAQAGWALEECWTTGTNISGYNEECELTTLGSSLVISGFVLLALGTTSIIIGGIQLKKAKDGMRQLSTASLSVAPFVDPRRGAQGLGVMFSF